jgi:hypothetical protein
MSRFASTLTRKSWRPRLHLQAWLWFKRCRECGQPTRVHGCRIPRRGTGSACMRPDDRTGQTRARAARQGES